MIDFVTYKFFFGIKASNRNSDEIVVINDLNSIEKFH